MEAVVRVENLVKRYAGRGLGRREDAFAAIDSVSFSILPGTTLALVGESGSGKSSVALCVACLEQVTSGQIWFGGRDAGTLGEEELRVVRPQIQLVFQDPANSLNPRWTVREIVAEPMLVLGRISARERAILAAQVLERVGLGAEYLKRRPAELSGGQRQRVAIARALTLEPRLLILDEVLSALDCSMQAQIANLLVELQRAYGLAYLFITHDLRMAAHLADEIAVMSGGKIIEQGAAEEILRRARQPATLSLLAASAIKSKQTRAVWQP
jgi:ABC-type dipeptide/oligopeptide/nickel transport system ATPase subunit